MGGKEGGEDEMNKCGRADTGRENENKSGIERRINGMEMREKRR